MSGAAHASRPPSLGAVGLLPDVEDARQAAASPLEVSTGFIGGVFNVGPQTHQEAGLEPGERLREVIRRALTAPPCLVSFSGGRDSSAILSVAVDEARRWGLALPVPVTLSFPRLPETDETDWQEGLIRHLELQTWERISFHDELDIVGPVAERTADALGSPFWPANAHFHQPIFAAARGGTVLTGFDGDTIFGHWQWEATHAALNGAMPRTPRQLAKASVPALPSGLRGRVVSRKATEVPWLSRDASRLVARSRRETAGSEPANWAARCRWWPRRRMVWLAQETLRRIAETEQATVIHPLADPAFLMALGDHPSSRHWRGRTDRMRFLFDTLLPDPILGRTTKANLSRAVLAKHSRAWASHLAQTGTIEWSGVDAERLGEAIARDIEGEGRSGNLLHHLRFAHLLASGTQT